MKATSTNHKAGCTAADRSSFSLWKSGDLKATCQDSNSARVRLIQENDGDTENTTPHYPGLTLPLGDKAGRLVVSSAGFYILPR